MSEKVVVLGANGTVGRAFCRHLKSLGIEAQAWNRITYPLLDSAVIKQRLTELSPRYVFNFAIADGAASAYINTELPAVLHRLTRELDFKLIHTSTVMVFTDAQAGPFYPETKPDADAGYGLSKLQAEQKIASAAGNTVVARLGWQIAPDTDSNNMTAFLERAAVRGPVKTSRHWFPSCSFVDVTAHALWQLRLADPSVYHINQNTSLSFYAIATSLRGLYKKSSWQIDADDNYAHNQIMLDSRVLLPSLFSAAAK